MPLERLDEAAGVKKGFRPKARTAGHDAETFRGTTPMLRGDAASNTLSGDSLMPRPAKAQNGLDEPAQPRGKVLKTYKWSQFFGKEEVTEFDEAHFALDGKFAQNSSVGNKEYQDRLRAIHFRKEGMQRAEIAKTLGRSEKFVAKWWQKDSKEVPTPWGVHAYLTKEMGKDGAGLGATNGATMTDEAAKDTATWWRDVEIKRKFEFAEDPGIYDEILQNTKWRGSNARTRDFNTGAYHLKYDKLGNMKWEGHQGGKYEKGISPLMDKALQKLFAVYGIADRTSGIIVNWYPDGSCNLGSHRHDCWTALFSFGHERILTLDNTPLLMQHGDLAIFGTQRHGVPVMPEIDEGRITLVVFFYPDSMQKKQMWQTLTDPETMEPSRPMVAMLKDQHLVSKVDEDVINSRPELGILLELGFMRVDAEMALKASSFDVDKAAEILLLAGKADTNILPDAGCAVSNTASQDLVDDRALQGPTRYGRFARARTRTQQTQQADDCLESSSFGLDSATTIGGSGGNNSSSSANASAEMESCSCGYGSMTDAEVAALVAQLDAEEENEQTAALTAQFQEYENNLQQEVRWNGQGDLMHSPFNREHLKLETMDKATVFSVGHCDLAEKDFFHVLQCHSIRVLYDVRATDYRGELYSRHQHFSVAAIRSACRARGIFYKPMSIGKESAYGTLKHIQSEEGQHTLVELAWQGSRKHTAFLGREDDWRDDARQVVAEELVKAGHKVMHIRSDGKAEHHQVGREWPDWLVREEERLKKLEKQRQAGELQRPTKSSADRSSEAIASRLARPAEQVDAMQEMRNAANQKELIVAQRKLARYERIADQKGALAGKVVKNTPSFIVEDARKQAEWVASQKKGRGKEKDASTSSEKQSKVDEQLESSSSSTAEVVKASTSSAISCDEIAIECKGCGAKKTWQNLEQGDGFCPACVAEKAAESDQEEDTGVAEAPLEACCSVQKNVVVPPDEDSGSYPTTTPQRSTWRARRRNA